MYTKYILLKKVKKLNKKSAFITSDVIEECLAESLDILEKITPSDNK